MAENKTFNEEALVEMAHTMGFDLAHACARSKPIVCAISTRASSLKVLFSATVSTAFQSSINAYHNGIHDHNRHGKANHADKRIKGGNHKFKCRHFEPVLSYI